MNNDERIRRVGALRVVINLVFLAELVFSLL